MAGRTTQGPLGRELRPVSDSSARLAGVRPGLRPSESPGTPSNRCARPRAGATRETRPPKPSGPAGAHSPPTPGAAGAPDPGCRRSAGQLVRTSSAKQRSGRVVGTAPGAGCSGCHGWGLGCSDADWEGLWGLGNQSGRPGRRVAERPACPVRRWLKELGRGIHQWWWWLVGGLAWGTAALRRPWRTESVYPTCRMQK